MRTATDTVRPTSARNLRLPWVRFAMVFVACVVLVDSLVGDRGFGARVRAQRHYADAARALGAIQYENAGLLEQIRRLQTDPEAIEAVAREELGMIRPGEFLFVITPTR